MADLPESVLHEGIVLDLIFRGERPEFGDLFTICGDVNPHFPPKTALFAGLADLGFEQVDDYFGIRSESREGDDVFVWLYPLIDGDEVDHEQGPFDGVRLQFVVLHHPEHRGGRFLQVAQQLASRLPVEVRDAATGVAIERSALSARLREDIRRIQEHWRGRGIECGSAEALEIQG